MSTPVICPGPCRASWRKGDAIYRDNLARYDNAVLEWHDNGRQGPEPEPPAEPRVCP